MREILADEVLSGAEVVAGARGIDRIVRSVTVGEVPDIADFLSGGELVLSTLFAIRDERAQLKFFEDIVASDAAALMLKPGRFVEAIPKSILKLAEERGFPVLSAPVGLRWTAVIAAVSRRLLGDEVILGDLVLAELAGAELEDHELFEGRLRRLGCDVGGKFVALAATDGHGGKASGALVEVLGSSLKHAGYESACLADHGDLTVLVNSGDDDKKSRRSLDLAVDEIGRVASGKPYSLELSVGISRVHGGAHKIGRAHV